MTTVHTEGFSNVEGLVHEGALTSDDGLYVVAKHGEQSQRTVLDLLGLQLSESIGIISETQRVEGITRVQAVLTLQTFDRGTSTVRLGSTD